jgi:hypothetical protein
MGALSQTYKTTDYATPVPITIYVEDADYEDNNNRGQWI